jgi:hypothetical protein
MAPGPGSASPSDAHVPSNGWWKEFLEVIPDGYLDLLAAEEDASRIAHFHPTLIPGLLQTEGYAVAITPLTILKPTTDAEVASLVQVRMLRQRAALDRSRPKELIFLMDEATLHRPVGPASVMREQLVQLLEMSEHPKVTVVVLPFRKQPHPGLLGAFMHLHYGGGLNDVLCFEWQMGNTVVRDRPQLAERYRDLVQRLRDGDPDGSGTRQRIESALTRWR